MPEGPEVETLRRTLAPLLVGRRLGEPAVSGKAMRTRAPDTDGFRSLSSHTVRGLSRQGKLLVVHTDGACGLLVHLGMSGKLLVEPAAKERVKHTHVVFPLDDGSDELRFVDPRRFGEVRPFTDIRTLDDALALLGPDPLALDDPTLFAAVVNALGRTTRSIKETLLDQSVLAGVGNIYVCEALFLARVDPRARACDLSSTTCAAVLRATMEVIALGIANGGTTLRDYVDALGRAGRNKSELLVFQREGEPCPSCGEPIARIVQGGRSTFFCRRCQSTHERTTHRRSTL
jgi:formamidopyrimidine-DNA glycosylase